MLDIRSRPTPPLSTFSYPLLLQQFRRLPTLSSRAPQAIHSTSPFIKSSKESLPRSTSSSQAAESWFSANAPRAFGSPEFARKLKAYSGHASYLDDIRDTEVIVDQWQLERLALVGLKNDLFFYAPRVSTADLGSLGAHAFQSLDEAIRAATNGLADGAQVVLVPEGPYTFVRSL